MNFLTLTIVSIPQNPITETDLQTIQHIIQNTHHIHTTEWLNPNLALDIVIESNNKKLSSHFTEFLKNKQYDYAYIPQNNRRKKLFLADMDATMIKDESFDLIGDALGNKAFLHEVTEQVMQGLLDFETAFAQRVTKLRGISFQQLEHLCERICFSDGAFTLMKTLKSFGVKTSLVTGGFNPIAGYVARNLGFDMVYANQLECHNGSLTGGYLKPLIDKAQVLQNEVKTCNLIAADTLCVGDGSNDIGMVESAGLGVAFYGKPRLCEVAHAHIQFTDLTSLLYFQGYHVKEFVYE